MRPPAAHEHPESHVSRAAIRLLAVLTALNVLNFLDRQLLAALAPLVMDDLDLTRAEFGLLVGFAFVVLFSVAGLFLGALADRHSRLRLVTAGLVVWSLMTAASGAAQGLGQLALARVLVGVGEATLIPAALSLLGDTFPPARLAFAAAVFTAGLPVGQALSYVAAGLLVPVVGWRGCFAVLGLVGLLAGLALPALREPARTGPREIRSPSFVGIAADLRRMLLSVPAAAFVIGGVAAFAFSVGAALHTITWLVHERGFTHSRAALLTGLVTAVAAPLGNLGVAFVADRLEGRVSGGRAWTLAALAPLSAAGSAVFYLAPPSSPLFYAGWLASAMSLMGWMGAALATYERLAPPRIRATAVAFAILCLNLLGMGPGALVTGWIGDRYSLTAGLVWSAGVALLGGIAFAGAALRYAAGTEQARRGAALGQATG